MLEKLFQSLERALNFLGALCLIAIGFSVTLQVVIRSVANQALTWPEEVSQFLLVGLLFLGTGLVERHEGQIRVELVFSQFPRAAKALRLVGKALMGVYAVSLLISEIQFYPSAAQLTSKAAGLPMSWLHIVIIAGMVIWLAFLVFSLFKPARPKEDA